jgi:hypothetical protein
MGSNQKLPDVKLTIAEALALARRYMQAISEGRIEEHEIDALTDEDLIARDDELAARLDEAQKDAERELETATQNTE